LWRRFFVYFNLLVPGGTYTKGSVRNILKVDPKRKSKGDSKMRKANILTGSIILVLSVFVIYQASLLPPKITGAGLGPGIVPSLLAKILAVLSFILVLQNIIKGPEKNLELVITKQELTGLMLVFSTQAVYLFSIKYLGFGSATCLFITFLSNLLGNYAWWKCLLLGLISAVFIVQIFRNMLGLPLVSGITGF